MHPLHTYISTNLAEKLRARRVVVWYDPRSEFAPFIEELQSVSPQRHRGTEEEKQSIKTSVSLCLCGDLPTALTCYTGSFFAVRFAVEPLVDTAQPAPLLIYIPGETYDPRRSVLLELEKGGTTYEPQLKRLARNVLRQFHTDGVIDELLAAERLAYRDIVTLVQQAQSSDQQSSMLKLIFLQARDNAGLIAAWLATPASDEALIAKAALVELYKLVSSRLGLALEPTVSLPEARSRLLRYLLIGEFRADLSGPAPLSISMIPTPTDKDQLSFVREVAATFRHGYPERYIEHSDRIEAELSLASAGIDPLQLGTIDTFRFEEQVLLTCCDGLLAERQYDQALRIAEQRSRNFWVDREPRRRAQWQVCQLIGELGLACAAVSDELDRIGSKPTDWFSAYAREGGWYRIDQLQRQLETWVADLDDEPVLAYGLAQVRQIHDRLAQRMAEGFTRALRAARWHVEGVRAQSSIYAQLVAPRVSSAPTAYILVDALRYEMGEELGRQLAPLGELSCTPALGSLPSITRVGMAALLPGASQSFTLSEERGKLVPQIEQVPLPDLAARQRLFKAHVPQLVDIELGDFLALTPKRLAAQLGTAPLIVIRSQEIDSLGESGSTMLARQVMGTIIGNVARAVRKLAGAGVEHIVITADHGHLFAVERGDDMKIESPGHEPVELHRRCWVGRGGSTPPGTVRVSGAELGYASDLDFVFPSGLGVFRAGGGLAYHHGGLSLQELVLPVLQLRVPRKVSARPPDATVIIQAPEAIRTRAIGVKLTLAGNLFTEATTVRPVLLAGSEQVGYAGMADKGDFDRTTGCVTLQPGIEVHVGMMLTRDEIPCVRVVVQNPLTDAVLGQTDEIRVELGM
ncbi:MAG: PglZ domain-containing protein [Chloroflexales bacterium]